MNNPAEKYGDGTKGEEDGEGKKKGLVIKDSHASA